MFDLISEVVNKQVLLYFSRQSSREFFNVDDETRNFEVSELSLAELLDLAVTAGF
jgi:hypothetical protein